MKRSRAALSDDESTRDHMSATIGHGPQQEGLVNSDIEQEDDILIPGGIKLPVYYPLSRAFKHQFRSLSYMNTTKEVDTFAKQFEDTLDESVQNYIDNKLLRNNELLLRNELTLDEFEKAKKKKKNMYKADEFIQKSREILENLSEMGVKQKTYSEVFRKTKTTMLERDEEKLTIENLPYYQNLCICLNYYRILIKKQLKLQNQSPIKLANCSLKLKCLCRSIQLNLYPSVKV